MSEWYWLVDGKVVPAPKGKYLQPFEERRVALDEFDHVDQPHVSTMFLGVDHSCESDRSSPLVFETMIFWSRHDLDNDGERYYTLDEAKAGHLRYVEKVKIALQAEDELVKQPAIVSAVNLLRDCGVTPLAFDRLLDRLTGETHS